MKPISPLRFNALGGYAREPQSILFGEEIRYFEHADERLLGMVIRDLTDSDYGGIVFGRDRRLRFRWVSGSAFFESQRRAEVELRREIERVAALPDDKYYQGDETGKPSISLRPWSRRIGSTRFHQVAGRGGVLGSQGNHRGDDALVRG